MRIKIDIDVRFDRIMRNWFWLRLLFAIAVVGLISTGPTSFESTAVCTYLVLSLLLRLEARWTIGLGLLAIVSAACALLFSQTGTADQYSILAFDLMFVGFITTIVEENASKPAIWETQSQVGGEVEPREFP
jgi:hypothetical protein